MNERWRVAVVGLVGGIATVMTLLAIPFNFTWSGIGGGGHVHCAPPIIELVSREMARDWVAPVRRADGRFDPAWSPGCRAHARQRLHQALGLGSVSVVLGITGTLTLSGMSSPTASAAAARARARQCVHPAG